MSTLLNLKSDKLINISLKNNCVIYGAYVREVIIQNNNDFFDNYILRAYTSKYDRTGIERDLYDFNADKNVDLELSSERFDLVKYIIIIDNNAVGLNILYMNRNPVINSLVKPPIILDIDLIQLSRNGLSIENIPQLYYYSPSPFLYILDNIRKRVFNVILSYDIYDIADLKYCRKLENDGWKNNNAKYSIIDNTEYDDDCSICRNKLTDTKCIKLDCSHYYHLECWDKHIIHQMKSNVILIKISCPLCRVEYLIKNII